VNLNEYQKLARKTAIYPKSAKIIYPTLGLCGESGEVAEKIKKIIRDENSHFSTASVGEIMKELGDVMWYASNLASDLGLRLEEVAKLNIKKLALRQKENKLRGSGDNR
jgi:NTP pyrophosphatase (non-canonical NTP hydrolase)